MLATKTELAIEMPTRIIEKRRYLDISGTWKEARGVMPETSVRKKVSTKEHMLVVLTTEKVITKQNGNRQRNLLPANVWQMKNDNDKTRYADCRYNQVGRVVERQTAQVKCKSHEANRLHAVCRPLLSSHLADGGTGQLPFDVWLHFIREHRIAGLYQGDLRKFIRHAL